MQQTVTYIGRLMRTAPDSPIAGRFAAMRGDTAGAIHAYRHYLALRLEPPDFAKWREEWEAVQKELAALMRVATP